MRWLILFLLVACKASSGNAPEGPPTRIVTLTPSSTELVAAVGAAEHLVGVDDFSTYPERVRSLPKVGSFLKPNLESILALSPHLVIIDKVQASIRPKLEAAGLRTLMLDVHTIGDVGRGLEAVGKVLGRSEPAAAVIAKVEAELDAAASRAFWRKGERPRVLLVVERELGRIGRLVVAGPGSYLDELIAVCGARNVMAASQIRYSNVSKEQVLAGKPEVIIETKRAGSVERARADWDELPMIPAVRNRRIHYLDGDFYLAPGPRIGEALRGLEAILHQEPR